MPFIIEVITVPEDSINIDDLPSDLMEEINHQYVASILTSIVKRRFRKKPDDIIKQIFLTKIQEEAEAFKTLAEAQTYWKELRSINYHYLYHILEIK